VKAYVVGGAVRDELLGLPVQDRDWVVVGATPEKMAALGFKPVGRDFPVFLHPTTHEEYALARTERKSGRGYKGFTIHASPEVTLEEDLRRRDLTINAMARDPAGGIVDPFGGRRDLKLKILRHVSAAFAEDPVRILRVARFAARFGFKVAPETMKLMRSMVKAGEADFLVPERVWQEFSKGLAEEHPQAMFEVLRQAGLQGRWLPRLPLRLPVLKGPVPVRFATLGALLSTPQVKAFSHRIRAPGEAAELALLASELKKNFLGIRTAKPAALLLLLKRADAFRRPERFAQLSDAIQAAHSKVDRKRLKKALHAASGIHAGQVAAAAARQGDIPRLIDRARLRAIADAL
jgi:tRNA nucleotidyltransferase (CCA-adding enzyme)